MRRLSIIVLGLSFVSLTACKSGLGERCQVNADCEDGLVCAASTDTCAETVEGDVDAAIDAPQDGPDVDATSVDAATDAATDAAPDA
jgi:hypothetical protein